MDVPRIHTALTLQGGGALGAYEYGAVLALYRRGVRPRVVTGVSIGAYMAAILAGSRGDPLKALGEMWEALSLSGPSLLPNPLAQGLSIFGNWGMYQVSPAFFSAPFFADSVYDLSPMREALERWVDFERLNASDVRVVVTAVDVETGDLAEFDNRQGLRAEHILASASMPPAFPAATVDGRRYWDGGLIANAPLRPAVNALEELCQCEPDFRQELFVVDLFRRRASMPETMPDVVERAFELSFFGKLQHDLKLFENFNDFVELLERMDQTLPADSPLRKHAAYRRLSRHRRIDRLWVVSGAAPERLGGPADFSESALRERVRLGYRDGLRCLQRRDPRRRRRKADVSTERTQESEQ
ncbi:MAG: patatin-like phospholipase family protein [Ectothiorhodospiraceae bacterium]|jgi:NTE family protein